MDTKQKALLTYEMLQFRKKRRLKGEQDATNFMFEQINKSNKEKRNIEGDRKI